MLQKRCLLGTVSAAARDSSSCQLAEHATTESAPASSACTATSWAGKKKKKEKEREEEKREKKRERDSFPFSDLIEFAVRNFVLL